MSSVSSGTGTVNHVSFFNTQLEITDFHFAKDTLFVMGGIEDTVDFDLGAGTAIHQHDGFLYDNDAFVAMYDTAFSYKSHFVFGDSVADGDDMVAGAFLTANSELILAGNYGSINTDFQPGADTNFVGVHQGGSDCFVAKYLLFPPALSCNVDSTGPISGPVNVCVNAKNLVYTIDTVGNSNATDFHWTFTGGPQPVKISGQGTRRVQIDITNNPFTVNVVASNSICSSQVTSLQVNNPAQAPQLADTVRQQPNCGQSNGALDITVLNPTSPPYTFIWSSGDTLDSLIGLPSGSYTVTVSDANACASQKTIALNDLGAPKIDSSAVVNALCFGDNSGSINIHVSGGAQPYRFFWSNGDTLEDPSNLQRGGYRVVIEDSTGCKYTDIIVVEQASELSASLNTLAPSTCGGANGTANLSVFGGTSPYTINWSTGGSGTSLTALSADAYTYTVTDANNCSIESNFAISDNGAPSIILDSIRHETCLDTNGLIATSISGGSGTATYLWNNGETALLNANLAARVYTLSVTDGSCTAVRNFELEKEAPESFPVCLATVDDSLGRNAIVWQKPYKTNIASFEIYRESWLNGAFIKVAESHVDTLSEFIDLVADPKLKAWSYKMKTIDVCGAESEYSDVHKTMHLVMKRDTSGPIDLVWNAYEGFPYSTFYIERLTDTAVGWVLIDSVSLPQTTYRDLNAPKQADLLYAIGIDHPTGCQTSRAAPSNYGSVRSNRSINAGENPTIGIEPPDNTSTAPIEISEWNMRVYPNLSRSELWIAMDGILEETLLELFDLTGRSLLSMQLHDEKERLDVGHLSSGVYFISLSRGNERKLQRIVIQ